MTAKDIVKGRPEKIISVRGPNTRKVLLQKGINCPEHYGDPALLLPVFYRPVEKQSKKISIIPHMSTYNEYNSIVEEFVNKHECNIINIMNYKKWTDVIDEIVSSSFVISESLHGLITAETYKIPCIWVEFREHFSNDWNFKFLDFFDSIDKYNMQSIKLYEGYNFKELLNEKNNWRPGKIDYKKLLQYFPFDIKPEFESQTNEFLNKNA